MTYDPNNIFARILRGEIPCKKVYEDAHVLAFHDIHPKAPVHVLICPKGAYTDANDFGTRATPEEIAALFSAIPKIAAAQGVVASGYRLISNCGLNGGQEVPHLHFHLLGGKHIGRLVE